MGARAERLLVCLAAAVLAVLAAGFVLESFGAGPSLPVQAAAVVLGTWLGYRAVPHAGPAPEPPPDDRPKLQFGWPVPSRFRLVHRNLDWGNETTFEYDVALEATADPARLRLRFEHGRCVSSGGEDPVIARLGQATPPAPGLLRSLWAVRPALIVSSEGHFVEVEGLEEFLARALDGLQELGGRGPDDPEVQELAARLRSPETLSRIRHDASDGWHAWVGSWVGLGIHPGESRSLRLAFPMPGGSTADAPVTVEHHGPADGFPGAVRLTYRSVLGGEQARAAVERATRRKVPGARLVGHSCETRMELVTDPGTLVPRRASLEQVVFVHVEGAKPFTRTATHEYAFEWPPPDDRPGPGGGAAQGVGSEGRGAAGLAPPDAGG